MRSGVLISGSDDGTVGVVDLRHLKSDKSHVMRGHLGPVTAVQLNGGNYVASGSTDRTVSRAHFSIPHHQCICGVMGLICVGLKPLGSICGAGCQTLAPRVWMYPRAIGVVLLGGPCPKASKA